MESSWINTSSLALDLSVGPRWLPDEASVSEHMHPACILRHCNLLWEFRLLSSSVLSSQRQPQTRSTHAQQSVSKKDEVSSSRRLITDRMLLRTYPQACLTCSLSGWQVEVGLEAKLNQMSKENKMLTEMVSAMHYNYNALCNQFFNLVGSSPSKGEAESPRRKRKSESPEMVNYGEVGSEKIDGVVSYIESNSNEDNMFKRFREDPKPKISKIYVQTEPSDSSLVSSISIHEWLIREASSGSHVLPLLLLGGQRWVSMEEIRAEGYQRQPISQSLLQMLLRTYMPCQEKGAEKCRRQIHLGGYIWRWAQPWTSFTGSRFGAEWTAAMLGLHRPFVPDHHPRSHAAGISTRSWEVLQRDGVTGVPAAACWADGHIIDEGSKFHDCTCGCDFWEDASASTSSKLSMLLFV